MFRAAASLGIAAVGGGVSLLGAGVTGHLGTSTTVSEVWTSTVPVENVPSRELSIEQLYRRDAPGVVQITATSPTRMALGSGFVIDKTGHIVTNEHVIAGAHKVQVSFSGTDPIVAKVIGKDASTDVAVLQVKAHSCSLTPLPLGDSDSVEVGDNVIAIGNSLSLTRTATAGIVSAVERTIDAPNGFSIGHAIQTDAAINHGNSGGPLLNGDGKVIGVTAQIESDSGGNDGVGFAIPSNTVKSIVTQIISSGQAKHAFLGIGLEDSSRSGGGAAVTEVRDNTPADKAGLHVGDAITAVDGKTISSADELRSAINARSPGDRVSITYVRGGQSHTVQVTLAERPS